MKIFPPSPRSKIPAAHFGLALEKKLEILTGAAKYDASCSSSGSTRKGDGVSAAYKSGICHSWANDGRRISPLKVLYTNHCLYDCAYCVNRRSNNHRRARLNQRELAQLTIDFYQRNYIEGLFLSTAVFSNPNRHNPRLRQQLMPKRYLAHLTKFHSER